MEAATIKHGGRPETGRPPPSRLPDRLLRWGLTGIAAGVLVLIAYFFIRLYIESRPVFARYGVIDFVFKDAWVPSKDQFGALPLIVGTLITAGIALVIGVPVAVASALYVTELAPPRVRQPLIILVELLAAVPSVVYGLWGVFVLIPKLKPAEQWFCGHLLVPALRRRDGGRPELLHRRADPGDHDPPDRRRDLARGHGDGAGRAEGGRARPRRHPLGDDPHGRAPVLARRHLGRGDARAGSRDRRDDRGDARDRQRPRDRARASSARATRSPR